MIAILRSFGKYSGLLQQLIKRDLKVKYRRSALGYLWSLMNPLIMMLVITAVFSTIFGRYSINNFPVYLLSGQILFGFFAEATNAAMISIVNGEALIKKVYIPKYIFPLSRTLSSFVNLLFSLVAIIIVLLITNVKFTLVMFLFPLPLLYTLMFAIGCGLILSVCTVFFRDTVHLYGVFLTAWMYFTPIFYPEQILPDTMRMLLRFNPLHHFIEMFRQIVMYEQVPSLRENMICLLLGIGFICAGLFFFRKNQNKFILYI